MARREHSRLELERKLAARGFDSPTIETVLAECSDRGWQSDDRFAESFVRARQAKGYGVNRIRHELRLRGVDADLAAPQDWMSDMDRVYTKKYRGKLVMTTPRERASRARFLAQRGFTSSQIRDFFERLGLGGEYPDID
ncbi:MULTISPECIES: regulatory protein RecX [Methylococcus]|uniref:Regulatory protein RecX n=1 Tax=Methylococcus capsulatus TaxID=414 RepID=A0ABZ2F5D3_METCP|nr:MULTISPECIES: regulatory protein RecX [Methylococcus]MDF9390969.1 regulatory protein RecX [Methylococcus capsulatus]